MSDILRLVLSNGLAFISFILTVYSSILTKKNNMLRINQLMSFLTVTTYVVTGLYYAAVASLFAMWRNQICLKYPSRKEAVSSKIAVIIIGTFFSVWCAYPKVNWVEYIPAVSFLFCSIGYFVTNSSSNMRIVNALDILLFWLVFDYINLMAFLVVLDLFIVLFPFAERYVQLDKTDELQVRRVTGNRMHDCDIISYTESDMK